MLEWLVSSLEHVLLALVLVVLSGAWFSGGMAAVVQHVVAFVQLLPGCQRLLRFAISREVKTMVSDFGAKHAGNKETKKERVRLPIEGIPTKELRAEIDRLQSSGHAQTEGKIFAYVYTTEGDLFDAQHHAFDAFNELPGVSENHDALLRDAHQAFMHENALNPIVFPSLRRFENEVVSMTAGMLNGDADVTGSVTSGGTESILMAMKTYRDWGKERWPHITQPEMVAPITIHPAHEKAAHYFGFTIVHVPVTAEFRVDVGAMERAIGPNTIALLASAPQYCHGVVDPIPDISRLALQHQLPLHVDACFGGFMLPWVEKLGHDVPVFDFRLPGVTSMSADIHKYGFGCKGSSVVLYRNASIRRHQLFAYAGWPGGLFGSPTMAGTRPGGNLATAWVALRAMGESGYLDMARSLMAVTHKMKDGVNKIPGLKVLGRPHMTAFAVGSDAPDVGVHAVAAAMERKGWKMECQQNPASFHCSIMPHHVRTADTFISDLQEAVVVAKTDPSLKKEGMAGTYGMVGIIPDERIVTDVIKEFFSQIYS